MPPKKQATRTAHQTVTIDTRKLEKLIRDSVRSEMAAQQTRERATDVYTQRLQEIDAKVTEFIQRAISKTTFAYSLTIYSYVANHFAAFTLFVIGLRLILMDPKSDYIGVAVALAASGAVWVLLIQSRNPVKNSRRMVDHLAKINIIFSSYIRQIHQIDSIFEGLIKNGKNIPPQSAEQLLSNLQDAMTEAMTSVTTSMELEE